MASTVWLLDPNKNPDLIDFGITKNIDRGALSAEVSYDLCSDQSACCYLLWAHTI